MADWGALEHATGHFNERQVGEEGTVVQPHANGGNAPHHDVRYDATDSRHGRETGLRPWVSVDPMSGPTSDEDFGTSAGRFEDGPGAWRQT
jgi:hypothetical protein